MSLARLTAAYAPVLAVLCGGAYILATVFGIHLGEDPASWAEEGSFTVPRLLGVVLLGAVGGLPIAHLHRQRRRIIDASRAARGRG